MTGSHCRLADVQLFCDLAHAHLLKVTPKATDYANRLQQAQDHLQHVFEELRSYAAPLHLEKRRCNLRALIDETWEQVASISSHPDVVLRIMETDLDLTCDVDAFRIQQVFRIKPIREADLRAAITIATKRFDELQLLHEARARRAAREAKAREDVLTAVRMLASRGQITQQRALNRLRELAKKEGRTLTEVSRTIVDSSEGLTAASS